MILDFPRTVEEITPVWLTLVLRERGTYSNQVDAASRESIVGCVGN